MKKVGLIVLILVILLLACENKETKVEDAFRKIEDKARGTKVTLYMKDAPYNVINWVDLFLAKLLAEEFDITLVRIPKDSAEYLEELKKEKESGTEQGSADLLWIYGEDFRQAKVQNLLYGPFTNKLPNYVNYVDPPAVELDYGFPTEGYESPFGKNQFVMIYNSWKIKSPPDTIKYLTEWIKMNPGRFTYPQPPDKVGSAFIRQTLYALTGGYSQYTKDFDDAFFKEKTAVLWKYLNEIKPYLWQSGEVYPPTSENLDKLLNKDIVDYSMTYSMVHTEHKIASKEFSEDIKTYIMKDSSISYINYLAIPFNAPNIPGAMVVTDLVLDIGVQYNKNLIAQCGDYTVLSMDRLSSSEQAKFETIDVGKTAFSIAELNEYAVPELSAKYIEILNTEWRKNVLGY